MPNWTFNTITVSGSKESLQKMMNDAVKEEDGKLYLSAWFPVPETFKKYDTTNHPDGKGLELDKCYRDGLGNEGIVDQELLDGYKQATKEQAEKYGAVGWYDYNCKYFGCKWDSEVEVQSINDDEVILYSETPWCAPNVWLLRMSDRYPDLHFLNHAEYEEGFWEDNAYEAGQEEEIETGEWDWDEEEN